MLGLRGKSLAALLLACALALIPAALIAWQGINAVRDHFGQAYVRNHTLLNQQKILAPVLRELALSRRLADATLTKEWLRNPANPETRARFFQEARGYQRDFRGHAYFVIDSTPTYYYNDDKSPPTEKGRYTLDPKQAKDAWFFSTMADPAPYDIQVDVNPSLGLTNVWFNVQVRDGERKLGMVGAGLDLSGFLKEFITGAETGVTPIIFDRDGAILAHPDANRIAYKSMPADQAAKRSIFALLPAEKERAALQAAMLQVQKTPDDSAEFPAFFHGAKSALAVTYLPELRWYVMTAADLNVARVINFQWLLPALLSIGLLLVLLLFGFSYAVERLVLRPLRRLQQTAQAMSAGHYDVALPSTGHDEIGELSRTFGIMAEKVRSHTNELESRVRERTQALEEANRQMVETHKQIDDSIDYASLIQRAILPNRQMVQSLGKHHFVLWRPRDVVGGDFYVFRPDGDNCLLGVVDCAGHGVAGALMTMLAKAAIDHAINEAGPRNPAAVLARTDRAMRNMLQDAELPRALATNMDAALVYIDRDAGELHFAGAKMSLYVSDGKHIEELKGGRRALGEKRASTYRNVTAPLANRTFYLITDGVLDQAGGEHGFGFGNRRLVELLLSIAELPVDTQGRALEEALIDYQGPLSQRDDITVLSFKFE